MTRQTSHHTPSTFVESTGAIPIASRLIVTVSCITAIIAMIYGMWQGKPISQVAPEIIHSPVPPTIPSVNPPPADEQSLPPLPTLPPSVTQLANPSDATTYIGIVAGHWGSNDTGAMCSDGLTEVEINLDVAQRTVDILQDLGYQADLLAEFDPRLEDYPGDALISIHADSCEAIPNADPPASGFKVASVEDSYVPEAEDRLVACLAQCYAARTGMYFHANSITYDMTRYHTFYEIQDQTPAAIIEIGFMYNDRPLLTQRADLIAQGIVDGIVCFIESD
ncbi:MAG: N-acetylmuramoyl-L-alanine amidase [Chloroflexi bacterium]|nr:N-acetylmuramoyl-L-alanine amidase [Chloroflexota bacterium]